MEFSRDEILKILFTIRVELPPNTKLPLDALEERLTRALERAQSSLKNAEVDFTNLRRWNEVSSVSLEDVMGAFTDGEAAMAASATTPTGQTSAQSKPFMLLRELACQIGGRWEGGSKTVVICDESGYYCIRLRLEDVFEIRDGIPIIIFHYEHGLRPYFPNAVDVGGAEHELKTSFHTIRLLLRLLLINSKRLPASDKPPVTVRAEGKEKGHAIYTSSTLSFLLPILPLTMRGAGSLSNDAGCAVCGQPSVSRCAACQHAAYCSKDCQKADWTASHKSECKKRALASATWIDVDISSPGYPKDHRRRAPNDFSAVATTTGVSLNKKGERIRPAEDWPPPNMYDNKPFIVKIMGPEPEMGFTPLMVYDRRRSIEFYLSIAADSVSYEALLRTLRHSGHLEPRLFLFAKSGADNAFRLS